MSIAVLTGAIERQARDRAAREVAAVFQEFREKLTDLELVNIGHAPAFIESWKAAELARADALIDAAMKRLAAIATPEAL